MDDRPPPPSSLPVEEPSQIEDGSLQSSDAPAPDFRVSARRQLPPNVIPFSVKAASVPRLSEMFRYELDIRDLKRKDGYRVYIRRRLKWSKERGIRTSAIYHCPNLTAAMLRQIRADKLTPAIIAAFESGGIQNEIIETLRVRLGHGKGRRAKELTQHERALLSRLERSLADDGGNRASQSGD